MRKSKFTEAQIIGALKQGEAGVPVEEICRQLGIARATFYRWQAKYGGMEVSDLKRLKELEAENRKRRTASSSRCMQKQSCTTACSGR